MWISFFYSFLWFQFKWTSSALSLDALLYDATRECFPFNKNAWVKIYTIAINITNFLRSFFSHERRKQKKKNFSLLFSPQARSVLFMISQKELPLLSESKVDFTRPLIAGSPENLFPTKRLIFFHSKEFLFIDFSLLCYGLELS